MAEKKGEKGGNGLLQALSRGRKEAAETAEGQFFFASNPPLAGLLEVYGGGGTHTTVGKCTSKKLEQVESFWPRSPLLPGGRKSGFYLPLSPWYTAGGSSTPKTTGFSLGMKVS